MYCGGVIIGGLRQKQELVTHVNRKEISNMLKHLAADVETYRVQ